MLVKVKQDNMVAFTLLCLALFEASNSYKSITVLPVGCCLAGSLDISLTTFDHFWTLLGTLATPGHSWPLLASFDHFWSLLALFGHPGHLWTLLTPIGHFRQLMTSSCHL